MQRPAFALSLLLAAAPARGELVPVEIKAPAKTNIIVDARPSELDKDRPVPREWSCFAPCNWRVARMQWSRAMGSSGADRLLRSSNDLLPNAQKTRDRA